MEDILVLRAAPRGRHNLPGWPPRNLSQSCEICAVYYCTTVSNMQAEVASADRVTLFRDLP
jgi:hypothetical protein